MISDQIEFDALLHQFLPAEYSPFLFINGIKNAVTFDSFEVFQYKSSSAAIHETISVHQTDISFFIAILQKNGAFPISALQKIIAFVKKYASVIDFSILFLESHIFFYYFFLRRRKSAQISAERHDRMQSQGAGKIDGNPFRLPPARAGTEM